MDGGEEGEFPDEVVLLRVLAAGIEEGLLGVVVHGLPQGEKVLAQGEGWFSHRSLPAAMGVPLLLQAT